MRSAAAILAALVVLLVSCGSPQPEPGFPLVFSPNDTLSLVRYESRSLFQTDTAVLRLYRTGQWRTQLPDGTTVEGQWTPGEEGKLCVSLVAILRESDCVVARVTRNWLHDFEEITGARSWKEVPLNERWPRERQ